MDNFLGKYNNLFSTKTIKHCLYWDVMKCIFMLLKNKRTTL
jgi:hypothetical protein